jgi:hypothetical protein
MNYRDPQSTQPHELERLMSRVLDGEASECEARALQDAMASNAEIRAEFETLRELDLHARAALQLLAATDPFRNPIRETSQSGRRPVRVYTLGWSGLALAACLGLFAWSVGLDKWLTPPEDKQDNRARGSLVQRPRPPVADEFLTDAPPLSDRPQVSLRDTERRWLVVPDKVARNYVLIEVRLERMHAINVFADF